MAGQRWIEPDDLERIERRIDASAAVRQLQRAVAALPPGQREVIELVVGEGMTSAQAAAALGLRQGTVRVRLFNARRRLGATAVPEVAGAPEASTTEVS